MNKNTLIILMLFVSSCLAGCGALRSTDDAASPSPSKQSTASIKDPSLWNKGSNATWQALQHTPLHTLQEEQATNQDPIAKGWLALAIISKKDSTNSAQLIKSLQEWRKAYPSHPGNELIPNDSALNQVQSVSPPHHIALLLPLHGAMASSGQVVRNGFLSAYYDNIGKSAEKQSVSFYDTNETTDTAALYKKAIAQGADLVIGPLIKNDVESLSRSGQFDVRVLTLNYTPSSFFSSLPANFYEFGLSPTEEAEQVADKAKQSGRSHAIVIASDDAWGHRVAGAMTTRWQSDGGSITETLYFAPHSNLTQSIAALMHINAKKDRELMQEDNTKAVLAEQRRQDFDVIFIFAQPESARQIVPLLRYYYVDHIPLYSISAIYSGRPNPSKDRDINGVTFSETPWIVKMAHSPSANPGQYNRLYAIGHDAYLLSQSMSRLNTLPNFPIYGATGALDMRGQRIHQRLPMVTMHGGQI